MSDHCRSCHYDPKLRVGERAFPFTTLYWDFLDRRRERSPATIGLAQQVRGLDRPSDLSDLRRRAVEVLDLLDRGEL